MKSDDKKKAYTIVLDKIRREVDTINDLLFIYKRATDVIGELGHIKRVSTFFFNPIAKEYFLAYIVGELNPTDLIERKTISLSQELFKSTRMKDKVIIINDVKTAIQKDNYHPLLAEAQSEVLVLLEKDGERLGQIVCSSDNKDAFDEIDRKYLLEISQTISEKIYSI